MPWILPLWKMVPRGLFWKTIHVNFQIVQNKLTCFNVFIVPNLFSITLSTLGSQSKKKPNQANKKTVFVISGSFIFVIKHAKYFWQTFWPFYLIILIIYTRYVLPTPPLTMLFSRSSLARQEIKKRNWQFALVK